MVANTFSLILVQKSDQPSLLTPNQKKFYRLQRQIETLQKQQEKRAQDLDQCMLFYFNNIHPEENELQSAMIERITLTYSFYKTQKCFSKRERNILEEVLLDNLQLIFKMIDYNDVSEEIKEIFTELTGVDYDKQVSEELASAKSDIEEMLKEQGIDMDLSDIDFSGDQEDILKNIFDSLESDPFKKTNHSEKHVSQDASKQLQDKSVNGIYKRLAKIFHPDLERDETQKAHKEVLMKKLTSAYESRDLYTLLALEIEWINSSNNQIHLQDSDQLKLYNMVLKNQVKTMENDLEALVLSPKYAPIRRFYNGGFKSSLALESIHKELRQDVAQFKRLNKRLQTPEAKNILRNVIIEYSERF